MADDLTDLRARIARNVVTALHRTGEDLLGRAVQLAPIEEGTLRGSGAVVLIINGDRYEGDGALPAALHRVEALARAGGDWTANVEVSFNTPYAAAQHEGVDFEHPLGGQAKYLEQPFREQLPRYERIIAAAASASM